MGLITFYGLLKPTFQSELLPQKITDLLYLISAVSYLLGFI